MSDHRKTGRSMPFLLTGPSILIFLLIMVVPLVMTILLSFYSWDQYTGIVGEFTLKNWREIASDSYYLEIYIRTFRIALLVTIATTVIGVPEAYIISRVSLPWRNMCILIVLGPLFISVVARTLGWQLLFGSSGLINQGLVSLHILSEPFPFMFTETGVIIVLTHVLVPFMMLSVWAALQRLDPQVERAAFSLGASQWRVLRRVLLPQMLPGILAGAVMVFALAASSFATPAIIGGRRLKVASTVAYDEFLNTLNWPLGAATAVLLLVALVTIVFTSNRLIERRFAHVFE